MIKHYSSSERNYSRTKLPESRKPLVLIERVNLGGVSASGKLTGDIGDDDMVVAGSHCDRTLRARAALVSCTADS